VRALRRVPTNLLLFFAAFFFAMAGLLS